MLFNDDNTGVNSEKESSTIR